MRGLVTAVGLLLTVVLSTQALGLPLSGFASADTFSRIVGSQHCESFKRAAETARQPLIQPGSSSGPTGRFCAGFSFVQFEEMTDVMRARGLRTHYIPDFVIDTETSADDWIRMHYSVEHRSSPSYVLLCSRPTAELAVFQNVYPHTPYAADVAQVEANEESNEMQRSNSGPEPDGGALLVTCLLGMCVIAGRRIFSS